MADVFISYSRSDNDWAEALAGILQRRGLTVWWDVELMPAEQFRERIETELNGAYSVVVLWSKYSRNSNWVSDEADVGLKSNKLVQVSLDKEQPPLGFRKAQVFYPERRDSYLDSTPPFRDVSAPLSLKPDALSDRRLLEAIERLVPPRQSLDALKARLQYLEEGNASSTSRIDTASEQLAALETQLTTISAKNEDE